MSLVRTVTSVSAGNDGTATWAVQVYNDIGSIINYRIVTVDSDAATITFDMDTSGIHEVVLGGNRTLAVSNVIDGQTFVIILKQDGTGSRTVTWWANILWPYNVVPTLSTGINKYDMFAFTKRGSYYLGTTVGQTM